MKFVLLYLIAGALLTLKVSFRSDAPKMNHLNIIVQLKIFVIVIMLAPAMFIKGLIDGCIMFWRKKKHD